MNDTHTKSGQERKSGARYGMALAAIALPLVAACASVPPPPNQQLQSAEQAITNAEKAGVADYSSPDLTLARDNLQGARAAVQREDMVAARRLAELSRLDAELATARTDQFKAQAVNDEMRRSIESLKQEMQRHTGDRS